MKTIVNCPVLRRQFASGHFSAKTTFHCLTFSDDNHPVLISSEDNFTSGLILPLSPKTRYITEI